MPVSCRAGAYSRYDFVVAPSGHLLATPPPLFSVVRGGGYRTRFPSWTLMGRILTRLLVPVWCKVCRWVRCSGHRWWISFVGVGGAIGCVPHARPFRRRYLRMVGFRVFDYVYKHVRPYVVFVPGLTIQTSTHISVAGIYNGYNPPRQKLQAHFQSISRLSLSLLLVL